MLGTASKYACSPTWLPVFPVPVESSCPSWKNGCLNKMFCICFLVNMQGKQDWTYFSILTPDNPIKIGYTGMFKKEITRKLQYAY